MVRQLHDAKAEFDADSIVRGVVEAGEGYRIEDLIFQAGSYAGWTRIEQHAFQDVHVHGRVTRFTLV